MPGRVRLWEGLFTPCWMLLLKQALDFLACLPYRWRLLLAEHALQVEKWCSWLYRLLLLVLLCCSVDLWWSVVPILLSVRCRHWGEMVQAVRILHDFGHWSAKVVRGGSLANKAIEKLSLRLVLGNYLVWNSYLKERVLGDKLGRWGVCEAFRANHRRCHCWFVWVATLCMRRGVLYQIITFILMYCTLWHIQNDSINDDAKVKLYYCTCDLKAAYVANFWWACPLPPLVISLSFGSCCSLMRYSDPVFGMGRGSPPFLEFTLTPSLCISFPVIAP